MPTPRDLVRLDDSANGGIADSAKRTAPGAYTWAMSTAEQPHEPRVFPPNEALRRAHPLPPSDELAIEGLTEDEWAAFQEALADA